MSHTPTRPNAIFDHPRFRKFEDSTLAHLKQYFPRHYRILGDDQVRLVIRDGWKRARRYGLTEVRCVRAYIDLMCLLGSGFDSDVLLPWAAATLSSASGSAQAARADRLYAQAWRYIGEIAKDYRDNTGEPITARFVDEIRGLRQDDQESLPDEKMAEFTTDLVQRLKQVFPAKYHHVGEWSVRAMIARAIVRARRYNVTSHRGLTLFSAQMFILGGGFDKDLLLPWVSEILVDETLAKPNERVDRLLAGSVSALRTWWDSAKN